jgi:opacity protein-like surface antigen
VSAARLLRVGVLAVGLMVAGAVSAQAQTLQLRGFFDIGSTTFMAKDSFDAVLGSATLPVIGGGGEVVLPQNVFINVRASRYKESGRRVFVANDEIFDLGIENTVTITPLALTGGYRFGRARLVPYAGGGINWYRYQETDEFSDADEEVDERFTGYHVVGGAEYRIVKWLAAAGEVEWASVPDGLARNVSSVGAAGGAFDETNLGGTTIRVKVVIGR